MGFRRIAAVSGFLCVSCAVGCASSTHEDNKSLEAKLKDDTGVKWTVREDVRSNEPRILVPERAVNVGSGAPEDVARGFFRRYATALHASEGDGLAELGASTTTKDEEGVTHVRFEHVVIGAQNVPVFDVATIAHFAPDGSAIAFQPGFRADLSAIGKVKSVAGIDEGAAVTTASAHVAAECKLPTADVKMLTATLGMRADEGAPAQLVWRIGFRAFGAECISPEVDVDASAGSVIDQRETAEALWDKSGGVHYHHMNNIADIKTIDVTPSGGKWLLKSDNQSPKTITKSYGKWVDTQIETNTLGAWEDNHPARGAAVDGHFYTWHALRYFKEIHGRSGLDNKSTDLIVVVHDNSDGNSGGANAHYYDYGIFFTDDQIHIGDGDNSRGWLPLSASYDVIVHEVAHGITKHTSKLVYRGESGALNEAFSDAMGASAENWFGETKDEKKQMTIGERFTKDGKGIRDMIEPSKHKAPTPDHYDNRAQCATGEKPSRANDQCWVHHNSSIVNRAFSLMTLGGTHSRSQVPVAKGIGWSKARSLWYATMTSLRPQAGIYELALVQVAQAALQGLDTAQTVGCAWSAVGVFGQFDLYARGIVCTPAQTINQPTATPKQGPTCNGVTSGVVCNELAPFSAYVCQNGQIASAAYCAEFSQRCRKKADDDWTATLVGDQLTCD